MSTQQNPDTPKSWKEKNVSRRSILGAIGKSITALMIGAELNALLPKSLAHELPIRYDESRKASQTAAEVESSSAEFLFFKTAAEANTYLMDEEKNAGYDRTTMSDQDLRAHRAEQRDHLHRTIRFIIPLKRFEELKQQGYDPSELISKQVETVNALFEQAHLPYRYSLQTTLVVDWSAPSINIDHIEGDGIEIATQGKINYSWTDDTLWAIAEDTLGDRDSQHIMHIFNPDENGIDWGFVHEILHHTGFPDLYNSRGKFAEGPIRSIHPYENDVMCRPEAGQMTPASSLGMSKLAEVTYYYGPQHDPPLLLNETQQSLSRSFAQEWYNVSIIDRAGNSLKPLLKNISFCAGKNEASQFLIRDRQVSQGDSSVALVNGHVVDCAYSLFDVGQVRIPLEKMHLIYANLYHQENQGVVPITITLAVDPTIFQQSHVMSIEMVAVGMPSQIQESYFGKKVLAYSEIAGTGCYTVWLDG